MGRRRRGGLLLGRLTDRSRLSLVSAQVSARDRDRHLEALIAALPKRQREVIGLYYFVDLPVQQVADLLGVSSGTVKSTLADARKRLHSDPAGEVSS